MDTTGRLSNIANHDGLSDAPPRPDVRRSLWLGYGVALTFIVGAIGWAGMAPLESAAIASGQISVDTNRKSIQHLEGGIVAKILVREGDTVKADQPLVILDDTQLRAKTANLKSQIEADERRLKLTIQEEEILDGLYRKGLAVLPRVLQVQRVRAELEGNIAQSRSQLGATEEIIARTVIRSPISGIIVNLQVHTMGGVIAAGSTLMEVVPGNDPLVAEVRLATNDIDVVHKGLKAHIRLTPNNYRMAAPIDGEVEWVSADRINDNKTNQSYYLVRIRLAKQSEKIGELRPPLYPGMPVDALIVTGKRTALEYFLAPISRSFNQAFRQAM